MSEEQPVVRRRPKLHTGDQSRTIQSDRDLVDINRIIAELVSGGPAPIMNRGEPSFADVSSSTDLQTHINIARQVETDFAKLPAAVRSAANNNPVQFLEMIVHPDGQIALHEAGLTYTDGGGAAAGNASPDVADGGPPPSMESPESDS